MEEENEELKFTVDENSGLVNMCEKLSDEKLKLEE